MPLQCTDLLLTLVNSCHRKTHFLQRYACWCCIIWYFHNSSVYIDSDTQTHTRTPARTHKHTDTQYAPIYALICDTDMLIYIETNAKDRRIMWVNDTLYCQIKKDIRKTCNSNLVEWQNEWKYSTMRQLLNELKHLENLKCTDFSKINDIICSVREWSVL